MKMIQSGEKSVVRSFIAGNVVPQAMVTMSKARMPRKCDVMAKRESEIGGATAHLAFQEHLIAIAEQQRLFRQRLVRECLPGDRCLGACSFADRCLELSQTKENKTGAV